MDFGTRLQMISTLQLVLIHFVQYKLIGLMVSMCKGGEN